jgi:hypothetical protein
MKPSLPMKTRVPSHKPSSLPWVDRNKACVFSGAVADTGPSTQDRSSLSFLSVARERKGLGTDEHDTSELGTGELCPNVMGTH